MLHDFGAWLAGFVLFVLLYDSWQGAMRPAPWYVGLPAIVAAEALAVVVVWFAQYVFLEHFG